jgi:hypothetical protein
VTDPGRPAPLAPLQDVADRARRSFRHHGIQLVPEQFDDQLEWPDAAPLSNQLEHDHSFVRWRMYPSDSRFHPWVPFVGLHCLTNLGVATVRVQPPEQGAVAEEDRQVARPAVETHGAHPCSFERGVQLHRQVAYEQ